MAVITNNSIRPMGKNALRSVERQRQMASALQGQAMQPLQGQMAGRVYVPPSPFQGAAKLAQMLAGTYVQGQADDREKQIEDDQRKAFMTDMNAYQDSIKGTPMIPGGIPETNVIPPQGVQGSETNPYIPASGEFKEAADIPAVPGMDRGQAAMQHLMNSNSPMAQRMGESIYGKSLEPAKLHNVAPGAVALGPDHKPVFSNPKPLEPVKPFSLSPGQIQFGPDGKPLAENTNPRTPATTVNLPADQTSYDKTMGTKNAELVHEWVTKGEGSVVRTDLKGLKFAMGILAGDPGSTGPYVGLQPDWLRAITNPKAVASKEAVEGVVQKTLKKILGGQFGEKEGDRLIARAYNKSLLPEENIRRVKMLMTQLTLMADATDASVAYIQDHNGSLKGFKGKVYTAADIDERFDKFDVELGTNTNSDLTTGTIVEGQLSEIVDQAESILQKMGL
jgi:hypothetical protein